MSQVDCLAPTEQFVDCEPDVTGDPAKERRRYVTTRVEGNRRSTTVRMAILTMGPALANLGKPEMEQEGSDLARL